MQVQTVAVQTVARPLNLQGSPHSTSKQRRTVPDHLLLRTSQNLAAVLQHLVVLIDLLVEGREQGELRAGG